METAQTSLFPDLLTCLLPPGPVSVASMRSEDCVNQELRTAGLAVPDAAREQTLRAPAAGAGAADGGCCRCCYLRALRPP